MTNTPDEAERLLDELLLPVNTHEAQIGRAYTIGHLLPLVRSGLVMKRLEDFVKQGRDINTADIRHAGDGLGGFCVQLKHGYPARKVCKSSVSSLYEAINTALDAAGVEK